MAKLAELLAPGGVLLVSTGDTDAFLWRLMRRDYWYYLSDHVSFFCESWFKWLAGQLGLEVVAARRFVRVRRPVRKRYNRLAQWLAFWALEHARRYPALYRMLVRVYPFSRIQRWSAPPACKGWRDHLLVMMRSPA